MKKAQEYLEKMKSFQMMLLNFIENGDKEENFENINIFIKDEKINDNQQNLKSIIHLLNNISKNHYRTPCFFSKIEKIIQILKEPIKKYFSDFDLFNIFKTNKRILLFLIKEQMITIDKHIFYEMTSEKHKNMDYSEYFLPEIKIFLNSEEIDEISKKLPENFEEKREIGENDDKLCELIRNDSIEEFIIYMNKKMLLLKSEIEHSIFETNIFLIKNKPTIIEYAAFYGSIQIFKYLHKNDVNLTPSLWIYAIHSQNPEMINYLEEIQLKPENNSYNECVKESIKCHHNEITNYLISNFMSDSSSNLIFQCLKYYNFCFIDSNLITKSLFIELCKYEYFFLVELLFKNDNIDINQKVIKI